MERHPQAAILSSGLYPRDAALPWFLWVWLATLWAGALIRKSQAFDLEILPGAYVSGPFAALLALALFGLWRILVHGHRDTPLALLAAGPVFFLYALLADATRDSRALPLLAVDALHVVAPVLAAVGLWTGQLPAVRDRMLRCVTVTLGLIVVVYVGVTLTVGRLDYGDLVAPRSPEHEHMGFIRLSGPLGVSTGLWIILLPALGYWWEKRTAARPARRRRRLWMGLFTTAMLWTGSRLVPPLLALQLVLAASKRYVVWLGYLALGLAVAGEMVQPRLPEKWERMGVSDPGRLMAIETCFRAWTSSPQAFLIGVGSERLNILTSSVASAAHGELRPGKWKTDYGFFPYGPHGLLWWSLSSYGAVGALLRCGPILLLWAALAVRHARERCSGRRLSTSALATALSAVGLFFDDSHLIYPFLMMTWYLFYLRAIDEAGFGRRPSLTGSHGRPGAVLRSGRQAQGD